MSDELKKLEEQVLAFERRGEQRDMPFGAGIFRDGRSSVPANERDANLIERIVVDETLPYVVASRDGALLHINDLYRDLAHELGGARLSAGPAEGVHRGPVVSLKLIIDDVLAGNTTVRLEERVEVAGQERIFLGRFIPIRGTDNNVIAVCASYEDVTRQIRALRTASVMQARFQDFARASSDWFFECNERMMITMLSDRFTALVGQPASVYIGGRLEQMGQFCPNLDGEDRAAISIERRAPFRDQLFMIPNDSPDAMKVHLSGVPFFDRQTGDFKGYRGVGMDMTDRYRQAEEAANVRENLQDLLTELTRKNMELDKATAQAKSALASKNEFLASMTHELKTPLNAVIGFASSFEREAFGELAPAYREHAGDIKRAGEHLLALINDVLDAAVIESGGLSLRTEPLDVTDVIEQSLHMVAEKAREKGLMLADLPQVDGLQIRADRRRVVQILVNLLSNAVKFTDADGSVGVDVRTSDQQVWITVWDTGVGISENDQEKVFHKFRQVMDSVYARTQDGTGLGLHISRELARMMDGDISLISVAGKGSRFTLQLPGVQDHEDIGESGDFI